jgi:hypothetical protein
MITDLFAKSKECLKRCEAVLETQKFIFKFFRVFLLTKCFYKINTDINTISKGPSNPIRSPPGKNSFCLIKPVL